jgi:hypothetical protein
VFQLNGTTPQASRSIPNVSIRGPDASEFGVDSGSANTGTANNPSPTYLLSSCLGPNWTIGRSCEYKVDFRPRSTGVKTAQLVVVDNGVTATAALRGEGIFGCRPYLVPCNYADFYTGYITTTTVDSSIAGVVHSFRQFTKLRIDVNQGVVTCTGYQDDFSEELNAGAVMKRDAAAGPISGPGFFAVEFERDNVGLTYKISFACPTASLTTSFIDNYSNTSGNGKMAADPAKWSSAGIIDPYPATKLGIDLIGTQVDPYHDALNDHGGYVRLEWSLKRW